VFNEDEEAKRYQNLEKSLEKLAVRYANLFIFAVFDLCRTYFKQQISVSNYDLRFEKETNKRSSKFLIF
jgi:hypothetical protein